MPLLLDVCANHNCQAQYVSLVCVEFLAQSDVENAAIQYGGAVLRYAKLFSRQGSLMRQREWLCHDGNNRGFEYECDQRPEAVPATFAPMPEFDFSRRNTGPRRAPEGQDKDQ